MSIPDECNSFSFGSKLSKSANLDHRLVIDD